MFWGYKGFGNIGKGLVQAWGLQPAPPFHTTCLTLNIPEPVLGWISESTSLECAVGWEWVPSPVPRARLGLRAAGVPHTIPEGLHSRYWNGAFASFG